MSVAAIIVVLLVIGLLAGLLFIGLSPILTVAVVAVAGFAVTFAALPDLRTSLLTSWTLQRKVSTPQDPTVGGTIAYRRYRLDVEFEADGQPLKGSTVQEFSARRVQGINFTSAIVQASGQAILLPTPGGSHLIVAMFRSDDKKRPDESTYGELFPEICGLKWRIMEWANYVSKVSAMTAPCPIDASHLPLLLKIDNLADPNTMHGIAPDELSVQFGHNLRFLSATMTPTDDPVSTGIEQQLPWVNRKVDPNHYVPNQFGTPPYGKMGFPPAGPGFTGQTFRRRSPDVSHY